MWGPSDVGGRRWKGGRCEGRDANGGAVFDQCWRCAKLTFKAFPWEAHHRLATRAMPKGEAGAGCKGFAAHQSRSTGSLSLRSGRSRASRAAASNWGSRKASALSGRALPISRSIGSWEVARESSAAARSGGARSLSDGRARRRSGSPEIAVRMGVARARYAASERPSGSAPNALRRGCSAGGHDCHTWDWDPRLPARANLSSSLMGASQAYVVSGAWVQIPLVSHRPHSSPG